MNLLRFAEIRGNLGILTSQPLGLVSLGVLLDELKELGSAREYWFKSDKTTLLKPRNTDTTEPLQKQRPVFVNPILNVIPHVTTQPRGRAVPLSLGFNAERYLPYRILWAKVIIRATYDYALWKDSPDSRLRKFALDAERWLFESSDLELSFENICFAFDFPVERIRQKTRLLTRNDVKKLEFRERQSRSDLLGSGFDGNDQ